MISANASQRSKTWAQVLLGGLQAAVPCWAVASCLASATRAGAKCVLMEACVGYELRAPCAGVKHRAVGINYLARGPNISFCPTTPLLMRDLKIALAWWCRGSTARSRYSRAKERLASPREFSGDSLSCFSEEGTPRFRLRLSRYRKTCQSSQRITQFSSSTRSVSRPRL